jgi:predicted PurR-regulated permease PerM
VSTPPVFPAGTLIPPVVELSLAEKVVRAIVFLAGFALVVGVAWLLRFLLLPIVLGFLLTYVFGPLADRLENRGLARSKAVALCFGLMLAAMGLLAVGVFPTIEAWLQEAPKDGEVSAFEVQLEQRIGAWQHTLTTSYPKVNWGSMFEKLRDVLNHQRRSLVEGLPALAMDLLSRAGSVGLGFIIAFFVLLDGAAMKKAVVALMPNRHFENTLLMLHRVDRQISAYLLGTAMENLLVTVIVAIPLWLLGMPNALLFAIIFGAANVIPFAGPFIGASAGLLFSLLDPAAPSMISLVVVYVVVHFVDAMLISPWIMGKSLDMHPMTVIVGIAVGGTLGGVLGMLAIIPLIAVFKAIVTTVVEGVRNAATT